MGDVCTGKQENDMKNLLLSVMMVCLVGVSPVSQADGNLKYCLDLTQAECETNARCEMYLTKDGKYKICGPARCTELTESGICEVRADCTWNTEEGCLKNWDKQMNEHERPPHRG